MRENLIFFVSKNSSLESQSLFLSFKLSGFLDKNNDLLYRNGKEVISLDAHIILAGEPLKMSYLFQIYCASLHVLHRFQKHQHRTDDIFKANGALTLHYKDVFKNVWQ